MDYILNEKSLHGQFESTENFLRSWMPVMKCIETIRQYSDSRIYRIMNFYECRITKDKKICDLKKNDLSDELLDFQISLDREAYRDPYWDKNPMHDIFSEYMWNEENVAATSLAEAAVTGHPLLSFQSEAFLDRQLCVFHKSDSYCVDSIYTPKYLLRQYRKSMKIDRKNELILRFAGTRIDCSTLEEKGGISELDEKEYAGLISTFEKFADHDSWFNIDLDDGLQYKKYTPSSDKYDWFRGLKYKGKTIMKFRFSNVHRCFGYRKDDRFRVLRVERDHSISNHG